MAEKLNSVVSELGLQVTAILKERSRINASMNRNKLPFFWSHDVLVLYLDWWILGMLAQGVDRTLIAESVRWLLVDVIQAPDQFTPCARHFNNFDPAANSLRLQFAVSSPQIALLQGLLRAGHDHYWQTSTKRMVVPKPSFTY